jgi:fermentation-respiration switch protein FrsA (DUF1100 family)
MVTIGKFALALAIGYALIILIAYLAQRRLMYFPLSERLPPASVGLHAVKEVVLETPDGERVIAWYGRARPGQPTLLYFHGNGGNLAIRAERIRRYLDRGHGMFMMSYRGYSGSTGSPSEAANLADARLAYQALIADGVRPQDIILYGESLGSGIATRLAVEAPVGGLILESPYTSAADVGVRQYPFLPVRLLLKDRYDIIGYIGKVRAPVLVIHGERDRVVPFDMGQAVFAAAPEPKEFVSFPNAGHTDHYMHGSYEAIHGWIDRLRASRLRGKARQTGED